MYSKSTSEKNPTRKHTLIGGGIISYIAAYHLWKDAEEKGEALRITIQEKNTRPDLSTSRRIVPSLTPGEIVHVVPPADVLVKSLTVPFTAPGGIRVDDVPGINDSKVKEEFVHAVTQVSANPEAQNKRVEVLFKLGQMSMAAWQAMYDDADQELKDILTKCNFNPCREAKEGTLPTFQNGYRMNVIYNIATPNPHPGSALAEALDIVKESETLGYKHSAVLQPAEVLKLNPYLADFSKEQTETDAHGNLVWKQSVAVVLCPAGCLDTLRFGPLFEAYLKKKMGTYTNSEGKTKDCFRVHYDRKVVGVTYGTGDKARSIEGLQFFNHNKVHSNKKTYKTSDFIFSPGADVGTLRGLGFPEPEYARFAGASLFLNIPLEKHELKEYEQFNQYMYLQQQGIILSFQGRVVDGILSLGVGGTKAFYADVEPKLGEAFAKNRHVLQLNMLAETFPKIIAKAFGGSEILARKLNDDDLQKLINKGIAQVNVLSRAVTYDGFPTVGKIADNAIGMTHFGSGGVSFAHAYSSYLFRSNKTQDKELMEDVMKFSDPSRTYRK